MWMAKSSRLGAKGSFVIRERRVLELYCVSSQALRLLWYVPYCTVLKYDTVQYIPNSYVFASTYWLQCGHSFLIVWTTTPCICSTRILGNLYKNSWPQFEQIKTCFSSKLYFIFQFLTDGSNFRWALLNGKVRPLGLRGRTPTRSCRGLYVSLRFFTCCVPSPRPKNRCSLATAWWCAYTVRHTQSAAYVRLYVFGNF